MMAFDVHWLTHRNIFLLMYIGISCCVPSFGGLASNHSSLPDRDRYANLTNKQIYELLQDRGFKIMKVLGSPPLALDGDVAYEAAEVLPELQGLKSRAETHAAGKPYLWMDKTGKAELFYFYDSKSPPDREVFQAAIKRWADHTCIKFTKMPDRPCEGRMRHGAICVGNFGGPGCFSGVGNRFTLNGGFAQKTSVEGCGAYPSTHEFGHGIGFHHYSMRADRDQFITVNFHHFMVNSYSGKISATNLWKSFWKSGRKCNTGVVYQTSVPVPYDFMSIMGYSEADFGDNDFRLIYVAKNPRYQYMLDYKKFSGLLTSHFDRYLMNMLYRCGEKWTQSCKAQGISPPKCKHFGYIKKDCKCACQTGIKGAACEQNVHGSLLPTLDRARTFVEYPGPKQFTLKEYSKMESALPPGSPEPDFQFSQYATILLKAKDDRTRASVRVFEPSEVSQHSKLKSSVGKLIDELDTRDCKMGLRLYWGDFPTGRVRTECFSTLVTNEPEVNAPVMRARTKEVSLVLIGRQGDLLRSADFTKWMMEMLRFHVSFPPDASSELGEKSVNDGSDRRKKPGTDGSDARPPPATNASGPLTNDSTAAAIMTPSMAGGGGIGLAIAALALLCCLMFLCKRRKRKKDEESVANDPANTSDEGSSGDDSD